jgi:hypothetical protein
MTNKRNTSSITFKMDFLDELDKEMEREGFDSRPGYIRYILHNWRRQKK